MPGTAGLEHRIGGIEKADGTGDISYDPDNHDFMVRTRRPRSTASRVLPPLEVDDPTATPSARARLGLDVRADRRRLPASATRAPVAQAHLRHLNPFPRTSATCCAATTGVCPR
jgi:2-oxoglutarate ferredoxin oxidoreductase subunit alpha